MTATSKALSFQHISSVYQFLSRAVNPLQWGKLWELQRLRNHERYKPTKTSLLDHPTRIVDTASFLSAYHAIFEDEIYAFEPRNEVPIIIDGGANIGLATLYWKKKWPNAKIVAFEPDPEVFDILRWNCEQHRCTDVTLVTKGLWSTDTALQFCPDGADAGHLKENTSTMAGGKAQNDTVSVPVVRLAPYLDQSIDLLKLDIEGAETEVLLDCQEELDTVDHLFVEYHSYLEQEQRLDEILRVLREVGFRVHIQPELVADKPFIHQLDSYGMDHRLNIFAYRQ